MEDAKFPPGISVESAWRVSGGTSLAAVHAKLEKPDPKEADVYADRTICAVARYGKGLVMVASFGNMFNDKNLGNDWAHNPDPAQRARYDLLFALLRRLVQDEPWSCPREAWERPSPRSPFRSIVRPAALRRRGMAGRKTRIFLPFHLPSAKT